MTLTRPRANPPQWHGGAIPCRRLALAARRWLNGLGAILLIVSLPLAASERWQSDNYLTESFMAIAMAREYGHQQPVRFVRWQQPIRLKIINEFGDKPLQREVVRVQSIHLTSITGHPISLVEQGANLTIIMTRRQQMASWARRTIGQDASVKTALKEGLCIANFATNARYEIRRATIIIPVDDSRAKGRFLDCVAEEFSQIMGLPNDSDRVFPSIFNDHSIDSFPTGLDYVLLKLAYHPALHPGMTAAEVRTALPVAIKALRADGEISQANRRVRRLSLKEWAGL